MVHDGNLDEYLAEQVGVKEAINGTRRSHLEDKWKRSSLRTGRMKASERDQDVESWAIRLCEIMLGKCRITRIDQCRFPKFASKFLSRHLLLNYALTYADDVSAGAFPVLSSSCLPHPGAYVTKMPVAIAMFRSASPSDCRYETRDATSRFRPALPTH